MTSSLLYFLVAAIVLLQVILFVMGRRLRRKEKENNVLFKYDIDSRQKAWRPMADQSIPEDDRKKIKEFYEGDA